MFSETLVFTCESLRSCSLENQYQNLHRRKTLKRRHRMLSECSEIFKDPQIEDWSVSNTHHCVTRAALTADGKSSSCVSHACNGGCSR
jgi:hypothetical protein